MSAAGSRLQAVGNVWSINSRIPDKAISGIYQENGGATHPEQWPWQL